MEVKNKKIGFRDFLNIKEIITIDKTINISHSMQIIDLTRKTRNKLCSRADGNLEILLLERQDLVVLSQ